MGIYVKSMEMPSKCLECDFCHFYGDDYYALCKRQRELRDGLMQWKRIVWSEKDSGCPLVEVKTPHSRLIDADELKTAFPRRENGQDVKIASVRATINHMPTVIEAEE